MTTTKYADIAVIQQMITAASAVLPPPAPWSLPPSPTWSRNATDMPKWTNMTDMSRWKRNWMDMRRWKRNATDMPVLLLKIMW